MIRARAFAHAVVLTIVLVVVAWELAFDINDPTIPVVREVIFTVGSILGFAAFLELLLEEVE
jgi:hypothetical protein